MKILILSLLLVTAITFPCNLVEPEEGYIFTGEETVFELNCPDPSGLEISWVFDGSTLVPGGTTSSFTFDESGVQTITVIVKSGGSVLFQPSLSVHVLNPPLAQRPLRNKKMVFDGGGVVWTVNEDNHSISQVELSSGKILKEVSVGKEPRSLAFDENGNLWVTNYRDGTLSIVNPDAGSETEIVGLDWGAGPHGILIDIQAGFAYVTLQNRGRVLKINTANRQVVDESEDLYMPRGLTLNPGTEDLYVSQFITVGETGNINHLDAGNLSLNGTIDLVYDVSENTDVSGPGRVNAVNSLAISPDGMSLRYTAKKDNVRDGSFLSSVALEDDDINRTLIGLVNLETGEEELGRRIDLDDACMPNAAEFDDAGKYFAVTTECSNTTSLFASLNDQQAYLHAPKLLGTELAPTDVLLRNNRAYVHYFTSREVGIYSYDNNTSSLDRVSVQKTVAVDSLSDQVLFGKQIFYNAADQRMSKAGYIACSSCHLGGNSDHSVYDMTQLGEGLRRTTSLKGKGLKQGLLHFSANFDELQDFEHPMRDFFQGTGFLQTPNVPDALGQLKAGMSQELDALAAYFSSLTKTERSPFREADGTLTREAERGEVIFKSEEAGCYACHSGRYYTSSRLYENTRHDVGTVTRETLLLDVPTLVGAWRGGPYLHDGSAATLMDVITTRNPQDQHGVTSHLNNKERDDLVEFLQSIDGYDDADWVESIELVFPVSIDVGLTTAINYELVPGSLSGTEVSFYVNDPEIAEVVDGSLVTKKDGILELVAVAEDGGGAFVRKQVIVGNATAVKPVVDLKDLSGLRVSVKNVLGREVSSHSLDTYKKWNGLDNRGQKVPQGIYYVMFYRGNNLIRKNIYSRSH